MLGLAPLFPQVAPFSQKLDLALALASNTDLSYRSPWNPTFSIRGWGLACNSPNCPLGKNFGHVLGPACPKSPQIMEPMETNIFQKGPGAWPGISQTGPLSKNSGHVLGPAWPKSPQVMGPMEATSFPKDMGPAQRSLQAHPLGTKTLPHWWAMGSRT